MRLALLVPLALAAPLAAADFTIIRTISTPETAPGPRVAVVIPARAQPNTIGLADQLGALRLPKGTLSVVEYDAASTGTATLAAAWEAGMALAPAELVLVTNGKDPSGKEEKLQLPHLSSSVPFETTRMMQAAVASSFDQPPAVAVEPINPTVVPVHTLAYAVQDTPQSRVNRWNRLFVYEILASKGMAPDRESLTSTLSQRTPNYAMYDCEGVGGLGPSRLERIIGMEPLGLAITHVSPEDIRDGALGGFTGVLFPGGSGKSIAMALGGDGQERVRQFVHGGGGYVGICAGSYLATCRIDGYLKMAGLYHDQPWAKGTGMLEIELTPEGEALFGSEFHHFTTRYNNGPVFIDGDELLAEGDFAPTLTLARFKTAAPRKDGTPSAEMVGTPAISATEYGQGRLLLISPHPETHDELFPLVGRGLRWALKLDGKATPGGG